MTHTHKITKTFTSADAGVRLIGRHTLIPDADAGWRSFNDQRAVNTFMGIPEKGRPSSKACIYHVAARGIGVEPDTAIWAAHPDSLHLIRGLPHSLTP